MKLFTIIPILFFFMAGILAGCGGSTSDFSFKDIPHYPASAPEQEMEGASPGGMVGGELTQLSTTDPFDAVVAFYSDELDKYNPKTLSHTSELGRQTALTISQGKKVFTIAIQEHDEEERVVITHMAVGR